MEVCSCNKANSVAARTKGASVERKGEGNLFCVCVRACVLVVLTIMQYFSHQIRLSRGKLTGSLLSSQYNETVQGRNEYLAAPPACLPLICSQFSQCFLRAQRCRAQPENKYGILKMKILVLWQFCYCNFNVKDETTPTKMMKIRNLMIIITLLHPNSMELSHSQEANSRSTGKEIPGIL